MKEKLIAFVRNEENKRRVKNINWCVHLVIFAIIVINNVDSECYSVKIPEVIGWVMATIFFIWLFLRESIFALFRKNDKLETNKISLILFSDLEFVSCMALLILIPLSILLHTLLGLPMNIFVAICLIIIILALDFFIAFKISEHFSQKLKK